MTTPNDPSDARLKEAMARIKAILKEYDIVGHVHLGSPTHTEFLYYFPTWSIVQLGRVGEQAAVRIRSKLADYPSPAARHAAAEATVHVLLRFRDQAALTFAQMGHLEQLLRQRPTNKFVGLQLYSPSPFGSWHVALGILSGFPSLTAYPLGWLTRADLARRTEAEQPHRRPPRLGRLRPVPVA